MPDNAMMPPAASQMEHRHSHVGVWFLGLLTMVLIVFIAGAGIWLYQQRGAETASADAANDRVTQLEADLSDAQAQIVELETPEEILERYDGSSFYPAFNYPEGWHIVAHDYLGEIRHQIQVSPRPIFICYACDGSGTPIFISTFTTDQSITAPNYDEDEYYENVVRETEAFPNGTLIHQTGFRKPGMDDGAEFETYFFIGETYSVNVYFEDPSEASTSTSPDQAGWEVIRDSLDFSAID